MSASSKVSENMPETRYQGKANMTATIITIIIGFIALASMVYRSGAEVATVQVKVQGVQKWQEDHATQTGVQMRELDQKLTSITREQTEQGKALSRVEGVVQEIAKRVK